MTSKAARSAAIMPTRTIRTLMSALIDYAGLFPPAKLDMQEAIETYNRCRIGEHEFMLGRFICPVSRLDELEMLGSSLMPGTHGRSGYREMADAAVPWTISALADGILEADLDRIDIFNERHSRPENGMARVDAIEVKVNEAKQIDAALDEIPEDITAYFEFPVTTDCRGFVAALAGNHACAKIRTGGVVGNAFPTTQEVASFIHACAAADVPFKATAGLHHPVRGNYRLTYEKNSPSHMMHGFLNVFIAAAIAKIQKPDEAVTRAILSSEEPALFRFGEEVLGWKEHLVTVTDLARVRETFAASFGSCSFDEPVEELLRLGLL